MAALTTSRKQRLRTLENHIRKAAEQIQKNGLEIGRDLCEIRDDELWKEEGYESWNQYLKERAGELVGKSFVAAVKLIRAAEIIRHLPNRIDVDSNLSPSHLIEIGRLAPTVGKTDERGAEKDYSRLRKKDVERVLKSAQKIAGNGAPSVRDVRKAVDQDLGKDRAAEAAARKEQRDAGIDLEDYLRQSLGRIQGITSNLKNVPGESWELLEDSHPKLAARVAEACDELAELLRS